MLWVTVCTDPSRSQGFPFLEPACLAADNSKLASAPDWASWQGNRVVAERTMAASGVGLGLVWNDSPDLPTRVSSFLRVLPALDIASIWCRSWIARNACLATCPRAVNQFLCRCFSYQAFKLERVKSSELLYRFHVIEQRSGVLLSDGVKLAPNCWEFRVASSFNCLLKLKSWNTCLHLLRLKCYFYHRASNSWRYVEYLVSLKL